MMLQRFFVAFLVGSLMNAATFQNFPASGLDLIPASSPEFNQIATEYLSPDQLGPIEPILPYAVIVRNNGTPKIILFTIRWASPDRSLSVCGFSFGPSLALNGLVLMSPDGGSRVLEHYDGKMQGGGRGGGMGRGGSVSRTAQRLSAVDVTVSLDLVVFEDHTYIGPNQGGIVEEENRQYEARRTLAEELKIMAPEKRVAFLEAIQNQPVPDEGLSQDVWDRRSAAMGLVDTAKYGFKTEELFQTYMDQIISESQPLHRRKQ
jgi:hypothetical protein